jgi:hypothetical protein
MEQGEDSPFERERLADLPAQEPSEGIDADRRHKQVRIDAQGSGGIGAQTGADRSAKEGGADQPRPRDEPRVAAASSRADPVSKWTPRFEKCNG